MSALRVIKVGGSLLDRPDLPERLRAVIEQAGPGRRVLLAGGGRLADAVRHYDRLWSLPPEFAHQLAADTMRLTARLLARLVGLPLVDAVPDAAAGAASVVLDPTRWLRCEEPLAPGPRLAHDWSVTSDSIAARLALAHEASELWLLKSVDASHRDARRLGEEGVVDPDFAEHLGELPWKLLAIN